MSSCWGGAIGGEYTSGAEGLVRARVYGAFFAPCVHSNMQQHVCRQQMSPSRRGCGCFQLEAAATDKEWP